MGAYRRFSPYIWALESAHLGLQNPYFGPPIWAPPGELIYGFQPDARSNGPAPEQGLAHMGSQIGVPNPLFGTPFWRGIWAQITLTPVWDTNVT